MSGKISLVAHFVEVVDLTGSFAWQRDARF